MAAGVIEPLYSRDVLRLAASIPGLRSFAEMGDSAVLRSATCGSRVVMRITLDEAGRVVSLEQAVEACAFGQAAAALAGVERWLDEDVAEPWFGVGVLDPARARRGRHGAILLPFRALVGAIEAAQ